MLKVKLLLILIQVLRNSLADSKYLSSFLDNHQASLFLFNKAVLISCYDSIRVTSNSFKIPNSIFWNFTNNEQRSLFKVFDTPKDSTSILILLLLIHDIHSYYNYY